MSDGQVDILVVGILQETKLIDGICTRISDGYKVVAAPAPSRHQGDVALFNRYSPAFAVEVICKFGAIVVACELALG